MAAVGLMQNFAALRALVSEGIQRGHMSLHAHNIALAAGAPLNAIQEVSNYMIEVQRVNLDAAKEYIVAHRLQAKLRSQFPSLSNLTIKDSKLPSMFFFEESFIESEFQPQTSKEDRLFLNVAFPTIGDGDPVILELTKNARPSPLHNIIFGEKTYEWLMNLISQLEHHKLHPTSSNTALRRNKLQTRKLKCISLLLNVISWRLLSICREPTKKFLAKVFENIDTTEMERMGFPDHLNQSPHHRTFSMNKLRLAFSLPKPLEPYCDPDDGSMPAHWSLPDLNVFQNSILDDNFAELDELVSVSMDSIDRDEFDQEVIDAVTNVGFPLLLALWQIFEIRVVQWVGHPQLASLIIHEQRKIIFFTLKSLEHNVEDNLRKTISIKYPTQETLPISLLHNTMHRFFLTHQKRLQISMVLLVDMVSFSPNFITEESLKELLAIGFYLEHEATIAHDVARASSMLEYLLGNKEGEVAVSVDGSTDGLYPWNVQQSNALFLWKNLIFKYKWQDLTELSARATTIRTEKDLQDDFATLVTQFLKHTELTSIKRNLAEDNPEMPFSISKCLTFVSVSRKHYKVSRFWE
jgi:hypothetical protein